VAALPSDATYKSGRAAPESKREVCLKNLRRSNSARRRKETGGGLLSTFEAISSGENYSATTARAPLSAKAGVVSAEEPRSDPIKCGEGALNRSEGLCKKRGGRELKREQKESQKKLDEELTVRNP